MPRGDPSHLGLVSTGPCGPCSKFGVSVEPSQTSLFQQMAADRTLARAGEDSEHGASLCLLYTSDAADE